jgi:adhesin transport system outer membrane protein
MTKQQLVYIDKNIEASARTVSDYQQEHELGRRSIIDLLNIELEYNNARNRKANTKYDNLTAYYQILSYTGKMLEEMNVVIK